MTKNNKFTKKEKAMKHVIALGLMTLQIGAAAMKAGEISEDNDLCDAVTKAQTMIAVDLDISTSRVAELFEIVLNDLDILTQETENAIIDMRRFSA